MNNAMNGRFGGGFGPVGGRSFGSTGHCVHMRGLPFRAIEQDIYDVILFFCYYYRFFFSI